MRLSCSEIRRLFWQLVVGDEQSREHILRWSWWRRWHQAIASYYHARRQQRVLTATPPFQRQSQPAAKQQEDRQPVDTLEVVWKRLEALLPTERRKGRPYRHSRRAMLEAIIYLMRTDCGWQHLPSQFPPWKTVYSQFTKWRKMGIWDTIWAGLDQRALE